MSRLTMIAIHEALAHARRRGRYTKMDRENPSTLKLVSSMGVTPDPEKLVCAHELGALMESAVDRLPDGAREVFMLRQVEGMSTTDVADPLAVNEAVVKTRLSRARAALRRDLCERADAVASNTFHFRQPRCDRVVAVVLARIL